MSEEVELLQQPSADNFVTEYWPLNHTCNYVWNREQILQAELANVEGYKAYILYDEYAWVHAVVIAKDYDDALLAAAQANLLNQYKIESERALEDYAEDDGQGGIHYPGVDMLDCSDHGYDISRLRFLEVEVKELLCN